MSLAEVFQYDDDINGSDRTADSFSPSVRSSTTSPQPRLLGIDREADRKAFAVVNAPDRPLNVGAYGISTKSPSVTGSPEPVQVPLTIPPRIPAPPVTASFKALQQFEGRVLNVRTDRFSAALLDLTDGSTEEDAEFDLDEVSEDDRKLVVPGAIFYWTIGYRTEPSRELSRGSLIWFRRMPTWNERDLKSLEGRVARLRELLGS